jgi:hypothetical protein
LKRNLFWYLSLVIFVSILTGSLGSFHFPRRAWLDTRVDIFGLFQLTVHRLVHFAAFGIFAIILTLSGRLVHHRLLGLIGAICFGIVIELVEFLVSTNNFEFEDVRDDTLAALSGYMLTEAYLFLTSRRRKKSSPL